MAIILRVETPLGVEVRTSGAHWQEIIQNKHPVMRGKLNLVRDTLAAPQEVRRSRKDAKVHLYYGEELGTPYWICVVVKHLNGEGFIVTSYRTDRIKEGARVWTS